MQFEGTCVTERQITRNDSLDRREISKKFYFILFLSFFFFVEVEIKLTSIYRNLSRTTRWVKIQLHLNTSEIFLVHFLLLCYSRKYFFYRSGKDTLLENCKSYLTLELAAINGDIDGSKKSGKLYDAMKYTGVLLIHFMKKSKIQISEKYTVLHPNVKCPKMINWLFWPFW